jgi:uncharacterized membrane protein YedE/YeeE
MTLSVAMPVLGGALLGLSAALLLLVNGRIAGVSGIVAGLLRPGPGETLWRALFVAGLLAGGLVAARVHPVAFASTVQRPALALAAAGVLVGFGTRLGNGCTSGHGICGVSRPSVRSIAATVTFMASGALTVFVVRHLLGGS